jgi:hypothetical protein
MVSRTQKEAGLGLEGTAMVSELYLVWGPFIDT